MAGTFSFRADKFRKRGGHGSASFGVDLRLKDFFFDRSNLEFALQRSEIKILSRIGAFLRKRARSLLRRRKRVSSAGQPPSVHSSDPVATLKNILFGYEPNRHSVVVGPVKLNGLQKFNGRMLGGTVPGLLEFGGDAGIREWYSPRFGKWFPGAFRRNGIVRTRLRKARYARHPFMGPTLDAELQRGTIPAEWKGGVTG